MKLNVISFNIHKGQSSLGTTNTLKLLKKVIAESNADLVLIQELVGSGQRFFPTDIHSRFESQLEFLADGIWTDHAYGKNAVYKSGHHGNAVLSRYPIISWENESLTVNKFEHRGLLHCEIDIGQTHPLHVFNMHLNLLHSDRVIQVEKAIQRATQRVESHLPLIIGGDFNDWNQELSRFFETALLLKEAHKTIHGKYGQTFPNLFPFMTLDRIYFKNLSLLDSKVVKDSPWNQISDHLPIQSVFKY